MTWRDHLTVALWHWVVCMGTAVSLQAMLGRALA